jgi:hypothetical protein
MKQLVPLNKRLVEQSRYVMETAAAALSSFHDAIYIINIQGMPDLWHLIVDAFNLAQPYCSWKFRACSPRPLAELHWFSDGRHLRRSAGMHKKI